MFQARLDGEVEITVKERAGLVKPGIGDYV